MAQEPSKAVSWLDHFSLAHVAEEPPPFACEALCTTPTGAGAGGGRAASLVRLLPGVDILDLFGASIKTEVWKDGQTAPCLVPKQVVGWEFYSLLWPQPGGTSQLRLSADIDLMVGRPPAADVCPSLLFAFAPAGHLHASNILKQPTKGFEGSGRNVQACERLSGNLDADNRTVMARLVVLCPSVMYREAARVPDDQNWGLFIGPRSRALVLLNKQRGRIDLHLACLLAIDASFWLGRNFIAALARLFEPFGFHGKVPALFGDAFDPLKVHSGLTNAMVVDHLNISMDGREDYWRLFGVRLPTFFLSNASSNLLFLTPCEAQHTRSSTHAGPAYPPPEPLPDFPQWTVCGAFAAAHHVVLQTYRERVPVLPPAPERPTVGAGILQMLGLDGGGAGGEAWQPLLLALASCTRIGKANCADCGGLGAGAGGGSIHTGGGGRGGASGGASGRTATPPRGWGSGREDPGAGSLLRAPSAVGWAAGSGHTSLRTPMGSDFVRTPLNFGSDFARSPSNARGNLPGSSTPTGMWMPEPEPPIEH